MKVDVPSYDHQSCREKFQALELTVTDKQICAGGNIEQFITCVLHTKDIFRC